MTYNQSYELSVCFFTLLFVKWECWTTTICPAEINVIHNVNVIHRQTAKSNKFSPSTDWDHCLYHPVCMFELCYTIRGTHTE